MAVAAVTRAARATSDAVPIGPLTRHALEGFRRTAAADAPTRRGQARGLTSDECATVLARAAPAAASNARRPPSAAAWSTGAIVALLFHGALRRSEVDALRLGRGRPVRRRRRRRRHRSPLEPDRGSS